MMTNPLWDYLGTQARVASGVYPADSITTAMSLWAGIHLYRGGVYNAVETELPDVQAEKDRVMVYFARREQR